MNTTKKLITLLLAIMAAHVATAITPTYNFEVNGICYKLHGTEVSVAPRTPYYMHGDYSGDIVIPETVTYNGETYPVTAIDEYAFYWCPELTSIHIPKSIKRIEGGMCFYACASLSIVEIESLESWCSIDFEISNGYNFSYSNPLSYAHNLYMNGEKLTELVIPSGTTKIGTSALCKLSSLSRLEIPSSVTSIGNEAFVGCSGFDRLDIPDWESWMKIGIQGRDSNPLGYARKIFVDGIEMSPELEIPKSIKTISTNAFRGCNLITSVSIPSTVETIGVNAFSDCDSLKKVEIQDLAAWCNIAFANVGSNPISNAIRWDWYDEQEVEVYISGKPVTQLDIPEDVTSIGAYSFAGVPFEHVSLPNTLVSIDEGAFCYSMLGEVVLPESVKSLGIGAFYSCNNLEKVQINANLEVIPENAFAYCGSLTDLSLPSTVKKIERQAFLYCYHLNTMPMTDSLQIIDESAFSTSSIEYLKTGKSLTSIGDAAFYYCSLLKRAEICDQVTTLGEATFSNCYSLQTIDVGNGVHKIPRSFCAECSDLISVSLGSAVDTLEIKCFEECKKLITVICKAEVPPVMKSAEGTFFDTTVYQNATLYVPCESIEAYKRANIWQKFQNILGMDNLIIPGDVNGDGEVTIADANNVVDIVVMGGNSGHTRAPQADVNGDDEINIADFNAIIDLIIKND